MDGSGAITVTPPGFEGRLKLAGLLLSAGLAVQVSTLFWTHPLTFVAFIALGGSLVGLGVIVYLYALVSRT